MLAAHTVLFLAKGSDAYSLTAPFAKVNGMAGEQELKNSSDSISPPKTNFASTSKLNVPRARRVWRRVKVYWKTTASFVLSLSAVTTVIVVAALLVEDLTRNAIYIEPISVPKSMAELGYTPEVSARRLRDAINRVVSAAHTSISGPNVALHGDQPDIVVPTVGISLSTIARSIRGFLHIHKRQTISGEFTEARGKFQIRLRMDSAELFISDEVGLEKLDQLMDTAAMDVVGKVHPYLAAAARWQMDPDLALETADLVIRQALTSVKNIAAALY
jgi:hypothetical protein